MSHSQSPQHTNVAHDYHPIVRMRITKIYVEPSVKMELLEKHGVSKPYVYPEFDKVSEHLNSKYRKS